jgi:hypothetical protein
MRTEGRQEYDKYCVPVVVSARTLAIEAYYCIQTVLGIRIRDPVPFMNPRIRNPGWVKNQDPDPG